MTNALFYLVANAYWLIVAGTVLLIFGFVGLALFSQRNADYNEMSTGEQQRKFEVEAEHAQTEAADRKAKLAGENGAPV